jgi:hypothetical protein
MKGASKSKNKQPDDGQADDGGLLHASQSGRKGPEQRPLFVP